MKNLSRLLFVCVASVLAFAQKDFPSNPVDQHQSAQESPSGGWATLSPILWSLGTVPKDFGYYQEFVVNNGSQDSITIGTTGISTLGLSYDFVIASNSCEKGMMLPSTWSCSILVRFYAYDLGQHDATLTVNTSAEPLQANISSAVVIGDVTLSPLVCKTTSPLQYHFPCYVSEWNDDDTAMVTLTNNQQNNSLTINSIVAESSPQFSILPTTTCPESPSGGTVGAGDSCYIYVQYTGNSKAQVTGTLTVTGNAPDQTPYVINLCHKNYCQ